MKQIVAAQAPRGRPRQFEYGEVVERAMDVFWSNGYNGTSLPALLDATKLSRGSLYGAFGDKHDLFLLALDRYIADSLARVDVELGGQEGAMAGLRVFLSGYVDRTSGVAGKRGCLVVATTMELVAQDVQVAQRIRRFFKAMEQKIGAAFERAQSLDELAEGVDPATAARIVLCMVEGLRVVGKTGVERAMQQSTVDALLDRLTK
ncbi:TetR/AcrR family transcriptional regulator [Variovorax sp. J2P1-59]|uniref:TetR/AcrR family transcriptional regulator n=1 Tax=Variovorax flavidus TaxID=3053501 RepID=UPI00257651FF|nr:TetR/AcrR family transcriptional regulator [Variovorax sp. J2P1-59]MDM0074818.1 TetR/AcrR family transcriptional regulator [Variovorax sp. J2P1-59]